MVLVPGVRVSVDERALTARVEVSLPSRGNPLAFTVDRASDGHGWEVREPLGGTFAWRDTFDSAVGVAVAAHVDAADPDTGRQRPAVRPAEHGHRHGDAGHHQHGSDQQPAANTARTAHALARGRLTHGCHDRSLVRDRGPDGATPCRGRRRGRHAVSVAAARGRE